MFQNQLYLIFALAAIGVGAAFGARLGKPEPRDLARSKTFVLIASAALIIGLAIRLYGIDFGLPNPYHPDEYRKAGLMAKMIRRDSLRPLALLHPPLLLYLTIWLRPVLSGLNLFPDGWNTSAELLFSGRIVSAIAGTISIALVYFAGLELRSRYIGAGAALLLAVSPLHATCSRYLKEDVLFTMFLLAAVCCLLRGIRLKRKDWIYLAGFLCGASAASKYSGIISGSMLLILLFPGAAGYFGSRTAAWRIFLISCCCIVIGFAFFSPFFLIEPAAYLKGLIIEFNHASLGHLGSVITPWSEWWVFHLSRSLAPGIGILALFLGLAGAGIAIGRRDYPALCIALTLAAFYLSAEFAKSKPFPNPDRYVVQCIPLLALLAFYAVELIALRFKSIAVIPPRLTIRSFSYGLLILGVIATPAVRTVELASELSSDTRQQMRRFLAKNIEPGSQIATIGGAVYLPKIPNSFHGTSLRKIIGGGEADFGPRLDQAKVQYLLLTEMVSGRFLTGPRRESRIYRIEQEIEQRYDLVVRIAPKYGSNGFHNPVLSLYRLKSAPAALAAGAPAVELPAVGTIDQ